MPRTPGQAGGMFDPGNGFPPYAATTLPQWLWVSLNVCKGWTGEAYRTLQALLVREQPSGLRHGGRDIDEPSTRPAL